MPRRSLGRASLVLLGSTWLHSGLGLLASVLIGRILGPAAVGTLALNLGLAGLVMAIALPGFARAHLKRLADGEDVGRCLGTMLSIQAALAAVLGLAVLVAWRAGGLIEAPGGAAVFAFMLGSQIATRLADVFMQVFISRERVATHGAVLLASRVARLVATALVLIAVPNIVWVAATFVLEGLLAWALAALVLAADGIRPRAPTADSVGAYWRFARPFLITTPISLVQDSIDRVLVARWAGLTAAGYYHVARGLFEALSGVMAPPGMLLFTRLLSLYADRHETRDRAARETFFNGLDRLLFVSTPLALAFWALAPLGIELLYGPAFAPATPTLRILVLVAFAMNVINPYGYLFLALGEAAQLIPINAIRLVAYVAMLWLFVPPGGPGWLPQGDAGAAMARLFVVVVPCWVYFQRTQAMAGISFYWPARWYAISLALGLFAFHVSERMLEIVLPGIGV